MPSHLREIRVDSSILRLGRFLKAHNKDLGDELFLAEMLYGHRPVEHLSEVRSIAIRQGFLATDLAPFDC